jgi:glycosyltransferase involved in cell wall biosynthesis
LNSFNPQTKNKTNKKFLVIIPTHHHPESVEYSILSVLSQSYDLFNLVVIGDGVDHETRKIMNKFKHLANFSFIDAEKTERHAEELRDKVIREFNSEYITYLCDDDLFLKEHLEIMEKEILGFDFVHPQPIYVDVNKNIKSFFRTNLFLEESINWHITKPLKNSISLSGVTHSLSSYLSLASGWSQTPIGRWTDHYMWEKFFSNKKLKFKTSQYSTTIKLPQNLFSDQERSEQIKYWYNKIQEDSFFTNWNKMVRFNLDIENTQKFIAYDSLVLEKTKLLERINSLSLEVDKLNRQLLSVFSSKSWKFTKPLRIIAGAFKSKLL